MRKYFIIFTVSVSGLFLNAQEITHTVEAKETLYGLSKKYKIKIDDLKNANPQLQNRTPQIGEILTIPTLSDIRKREADKLKNEAENNDTEKDQKKEKKKNKDKIKGEQKNSTIENIPESQYINITIEPKETLYGLSKKYNTSIETIISLNPSMGENGPRIGEILKVPSSTEIKQEEKTIAEYKTPLQPLTTDTIKIPKNSIINYDNDGVNIVIILPFHSEISKTNTERNIATHFYSGAQIAMDSLLYQGKKFNVKLLDSGNEENFKNIIENYDFSNTKVIIGPLFKSNLIELADKLKNQKISIVSPFSSNDDLDNYENLILYETKDQIIIEKLVDELAKHYSDEKIYITYEESQKEKAEYLKNLISAKYKNAEIILSNNPDDIKLDQNIATQEFNKIHSILISDKDDFNTKYLDKIISLNSDQIQPISLFYSHLFDNKKYEAKLLSLGLIYSDNKFVNESGFNELKTINAYKAKYCNAIPDKYAIIGFDVTYDILNRLSKNGKLSDSAMKAETKQLSNKYSFKKIKKNGAWANQGTRIIQLIK